MTNDLTAYVDGVRVGRFARTPRGTIELTFDDAWRTTARRMELSLSLPKSRRVHTGTAPENYLWNLLPDAARLSGDDTLFAARLIDEVARRSTRLRRELDAVRSAPHRQTPPTRNAQPRNKDVGSAGKAGAFAAPSSEPPYSP